MGTFYDLTPVKNQKSFYGKAKIYLEENGDKTLYSYETKILTVKANGEKIRFYDGWTQTTGKHIAAFCSLNKKQFLSLPLEA